MAFHRDDVMPAIQSYCKQAHTGVEIEDIAVRQHAFDNSGNELVDEEPVPLEERLGMPSQLAIQPTARQRGEGFDNRPAAGRGRRARGVQRHDRLDVIAQHASSPGADTRRVPEVSMSSAR